MQNKKEKNDNKQQQQQQQKRKETKNNDKMRCTRLGIPSVPLKLNKQCQEAIIPLEKCEIKD